MLKKALTKKHRQGTIKIKKSQGVIWKNKPIISVILSTLSTWLLIASLTAAGIPILPMIWYRLQPNTSFALENILRRPVTSFEAVLAETEPDLVKIYQPPRDETLPDGNWLIIDSIGIKTQIIEEPVENYEAAFRQGVWRVPDFGTPEARKLPSILVAHRFGYLAWTNQFRRENSFFNLPKLAIGDQIEIIWDKRRYVYEVYEEGEGEQISQYTADLILYTCKFLENTTRIFRYARLLEI